jgi:CBS domain containing-hemolysin-like protein
MDIASGQGELTVTAGSLLSILGAAFLFVFTASLGIQLIREVAWHELKEYALRRNRRDRFDEIHDGHDKVTLSLEAVRSMCHVLVAAAAIGWFVETTRQLDGSSAPALARLLVGLAIGYLAGTLWVPVAVERFWGTPLLFHSWRVYRIAAVFAWPLAWVTEVLAVLLCRLAAENEPLDDEEAFEEEVLAIVTEGLHDGHLEADAREMIEGVMELGDANVADIMTPRSDMDAFPIDLEWEAILNFATRAGRTRIPVYEKSLDNIVGVLYVKDLLAEMSKPAPSRRRPLREILREVWQVPTTRPLDDLLQDFLQTRNHLAIVVDEYSAVAGLVTIEDVLEEIVGEIVDESDEEHLGEIRQLGPTVAEIQGRAHLAEINEQLGLDLPEPEDFDTIAGLVVNEFGRIPKAGETMETGSVRITVLEASRRKVERVRLETLEPMLEQTT